MSLIEQIESDPTFGTEIMAAAGIRTLGPMSTAYGGLFVNVMSWFSKGKPVGPVLTYLEDGDVISLMWPYKIKEPKIWQSTIKKALPIIAKTNHSGVIALKTFIHASDNNAYGIRWQTHVTQEILCAMMPILGVKPAEWYRWIMDGVEGEWVNSEINYTYGGRLVEAIQTHNMRLLAFKAMKFELPISLEDPKLRDLSVLQSEIHGRARSRRP